MKRWDLWIGGKWVPAANYVPLKSPHNGETIAEIGYASPDQVNQAIENSHQAFQAFRKTAIHRRADILNKVARQLEERTEEAARIISLEAGKPIKVARGEITRTVQTFVFAAEAAKNIAGETIPMDAAPRGENHVAFTQRRPLGVVTAITPFNFPANLVAHKVGPAIAAGNTIVLKPAEQTPVSSLFLAELFKEAGLPDGVLNILPGYGHELSEALTTHPVVQFITFTGSPRVGRMIRQQAGLRRVTLELGSNSPLLIDAGLTQDELDRIAGETAVGGFSYNGQVCISVQRVFVHEDAFDTFVSLLSKHAEQLKVGDPLDEATDISALISEAASTRLQGWLQDAISKGATIHTGGTTENNTLRPTVISGVPADAALRCEEAFGPVITVTPFASWDDAIALANESKYGLHAGVFTRDIERAWQAANELESGGVLINQVPTFRLDHMPYGGVKESGVGREGVKYALEEMTELKVIGFRTGVFQ